LTEKGEFEGKVGALEKELSDAKDKVEGCKMAVVSHFELEPLIFKVSSFLGVCAELEPLVGLTQFRRLVRICSDESRV